MTRASSASAFQYGSRAIGVFSITAFFVALGTGLLRSPIFSTEYFWRNEVPESARIALIAYVLALPVIAGLLSTLAFLRTLALGLPATEKLYRLAVRTSVLGPLAMVPWLLRWDVWLGHDLAFSLLTLLVGLGFGSSISAVLRTLPLGAGSPLHALFRPLRGFTSEPRNIIVREPFLTAAILASLCYIGFFSYYTVVFHLSCRTGWDMSIEDNILWNISHGGPFFKASPIYGPTGSHFRRHATVISFLLAPIYLLKPGAATLLVIQSVLQGLAAIPLFLFSRKYVGQGLALLVSVAYLFHPALQESNLFEAHYLKFGAVFLFTTLWLLETGRNRAAIAASVLTLFVREDVATWVILIGAWGVMSAREPRTSLLITAIACVYVAIVKFMIMPAAGHGEDELAFMYAELIPAGSKQGFGAVLGTVFTNPAFTMESLLDPAKLVYFVQLFVPLAFIPLRRAIGWFALIPAGIFCFISTHYPPLIDIHFQYSAHVLTFAFPAMVLVLGSDPLPVSVPNDAQAHDAPSALFAQRARARRYGLSAAMLVGTLVTSYQYGAVFQRNTSRGGPTEFKFGWDEEGRARRRSVDELMREVPPRAPIAASAFTIAQVSARPDAYAMTLGLWNAEYMIAPSGPSEYLPSERALVKEQLGSGNFGIIKNVPPFFLAKRGAQTEQNEALLRAIHAR
jgi:uncharacterized membrane protein